MKFRIFIANNPSELNQIMKHSNSLLCLLTLLLIALPACENAHGTQGGWQKVFKNSAEGEVLFGDKEKLIEAVRLGYPVRIGWGSTQVEHVANADFLSIWEGEVFGQIPSIIGQAPTVEGDTAKIRFRLQNHWTKMAGTFYGYSTGFMTDYFQDTLVGGGEDRYTATTWYVLYPSHAEPIGATPLWRAGSPNLEKWKAEQDNE